MYDDYIFFWHEYLKYGFFSNWYESHFIADQVPYVHTEQYFMAQKALLFNDTDTFELIMQAETPDECKKLGRQVKNFNQAVFDEHQEEIMFRGNMAKFSQNVYLKGLLVGTGDKHLVEASPYDAKWGIQLDEATARTMDPSKWPGQNLLGKCLERVREELRKEYC